jgi:hypothetical protein
MECKKCKSDRITKNGQAKNKQRYQCKRCEVNFVQGDGRRVHTVNLDDNQIGDLGTNELAKNLKGTSIHMVNLCGLFDNQVGFEIQNLLK